jgi:hypothetical protein
MGSPEPEPPLVLRGSRGSFWTMRSARCASGYPDVGPPPMHPAVFEA